MAQSSDTPTLKSQQAGSNPRRRKLLLVALPLLAIAAALPFLENRDQRTAPVFGFEVVESFPHDGNAYCQGLAIHDGVLYEGTGRRGESSVRRVDLETGRVLLQRPLEDRLFGEGITIMGSALLQLTWKARTGLIYDLETLNRRSTFRYSGEGWGLTHDGSMLIMSDGSAVLRFLDRQTFEVKRRITVRDGRRKIRHLNELEYVDGRIYANVWKTDLIARIDPENGRVNSWIDLTDLLPPSHRPHPEAVLNGIAWDSDRDRLLVTGKDWPKLFHIRITPR